MLAECACLLEDANGEIRCRASKMDRAREARRTGTDDQYIQLNGIRARRFMQNEG